MFKSILNFVRNLRLVRLYRVTYAPADSRNPHLPIQRYVIAGKPNQLAWRSQAGNKLFTALLPRNGNFASFRADRTLSVNFAGFRVLSPESSAKYAKTLKSYAPTVATAAVA